MINDKTNSACEVRERTPVFHPPTRVACSEHRLKCWPEFFAAIISGDKRHDLRRRDDRDFRVGDILVLEEFDAKIRQYTGRIAKARVTYITSAEGPCALSEQALHPDFCILSISLDD